MLYFLEKDEKIAAALGPPPPNFRWPRAAGDSAPRPPFCHSYFIYMLFLSIVDFSTSSKLKLLLII